MSCNGGHLEAALPTCAVGACSGQGVWLLATHSVCFVAVPLSLALLAHANTMYRSACPAGTAQRRCHLRSANAFALAATPDRLIEQICVQYVCCKVDAHVLALPAYRHNHLRLMEHGLIKWHHPAPCIVAGVIGLPAPQLNMTCLTTNKPLSVWPAVLALACMASLGHALLHHVGLGCMRQG
jgi:hypothetical protein